jgi:hypothetical protein
MIKKNKYKKKAPLQGVETLPGCFLFVALSDKLDHHRYNFFEKV